jgi:hypothetical protein
MQLENDASKGVLYNEGHMVLPAILSPEHQRRIADAMTRLRDSFPNGFDHGEGFGATAMKPRKTYPTPADRAPTLIFHNAGFLEPDLLLPLLDDRIYDTIASAVGRDFYLSNVWVQIVPPGTGRMGYHKDEHGSISITIPLDPISWNSGSTCLVPRTHLNTPPPAFCMRDIMAEHPEEYQLSGQPGDVIFFTPETWHGRAPNLGNVPTCRLFFNFYSRSSREATRWSGVIQPERVAEVAEMFPAEKRHMFRMGALQPRQRPEGRFERWVKEDGSSSATTSLSGLIREYFYWRYTVQQPIPEQASDLVLPPFRTTLTASKRFSTAEYLSHLDWKRTAKNMARSSIETLRRRPVRRQRAD